VKRSGIVLLFALCSSLGASAADDPKVGEGSTDRLADFFARGDFQGARSVLRQAAVSTMDHQGRYFAGKLTRLDGAARAHFQVVAGDPDSPYADEAAIELAESAYADPRGLYVSARRAFLSFVDGFPDSPHVPLALYRIGRTHMITAGGRSGHIDSARVTFDLLLSRFPGSAESGYASSALREIDGKPADFGYGVRDLEPPSHSSDEAVASQDGKAENGTVYWVQVGAFSKRRLVDQLILRLRETELKTRIVDSEKMLLVQVGPYSDSRKAEAVGRHISLVESLKCQVIQE
jgi:hypothetical protein